MSTHVKIRRLATQTSREWSRRRVSPVGGRGFAPSGRVKDPPPHQPSQVVLWPDTFNNYFHPHTAQAAVDVLEAAGFQVRIPRVNLCCGRPLYDFGMLDRAKKLLLRTLDSLAPEIDAGVPNVVFEPSCAAIFRDELLNLFPNDSRAQRLSGQTFLLSEFLEQRTKHFQVPRFPRKALIHGQCHHKSVMKMTDEEAVLEQIGIEFYAPAAGCCGIGGTFRFPKEQ